MNKSESIKEITAAIVKVMSEVKGVEKSMTVGTGNSSYKGVPDQEVKKIIGESMAKNGLVILPIGITPVTKIERWVEESQQYGPKQKQSVFTEVTTSYLLTHISGEYVELSGYGHGTDSQDKSAGKATTYALKYTLLYAFLVPTGKIDDADSTHSSEIETPQKKKPLEKQQITFEEQETIDQWLTAIAGYDNIETLSRNYNASKTYISNTPQVLDAFKKRKQQLTKA